MAGMKYRWRPRNGSDGRSVTKNLTISKMPIEIAKLIKFTDFTNFNGIPHFRTILKGLKTH